MFMTYAEQNNNLSTHRGGRKNKIWASPPPPRRNLP